MLIRHADPNLERLESDFEYQGGFDHKLVKSFRKTMAILRAAVDERTFYELKGLHYEKLKGDRREQRSMRLNQQFRLIVELVKERETTVVVVSIVDYH